MRLWDDAVGGEVGVELGGRGDGGGRLGPVVERVSSEVGFCDDPDDAGGGDIKQCGDVLGGQLEPILDQGCRDSLGDGE